MKKIFALLMAVSVLAVSSFAQTAPPAKKDAPKKVEKAKPAVAPITAKKDAPKAAPAKPAAPVAKAAPAAGPLKKDGTPDKRFKENKEAKPAAGPLKKDGTPDMRYKSNKEAAKKKG